MHVVFGAECSLQTGFVQSTPVCANSDQDVTKYVELTVGKQL